MADDSPDRERMRQHCRGLGRALAERKHTVIVNSSRPVTVDPYIVEGLNDQESGAPHRVIVFRPEPGRENLSPGHVKPFADRITALNRIRFEYMPAEGNYRTTHLMSILEADVILALGGSPRGTGTVVYSAEVMKRPVGLIRAFGGESSDAWDDFRRFYTPEIREVFEKPLDALDDQWPVEVVKRLEQLEATNPFDRTRTRVLVTIAAIIFVSVLTWFASFLLLAPKSQWSVWGPLFGMGLAASVFGSGLRRAAIRARFVWTELHATHPLLEWFVGVGASLMILLFALVGAVTLTLNQPEIVSLPDLRRVGFTITAVTASSSLFVEYAWQKISAVGKRKLEEL